MDNNNPDEAIHQSVTLFDLTNLKMKSLAGPKFAQGATSYALSATSPPPPPPKRFCGAAPMDGYGTSRISAGNSIGRAALPMFPLIFTLSVWAVLRRKRDV